MNEAEVREKLRTFILTELIQNANYPLRDDEGLITGGLMDSFSLAQVGIFVEDTFGVYIPDPDLTVAKMNTINQMVSRILEG